MSNLPQQETIDQYIGDGVETIFIYAYLVPTDPDIEVFVAPAGIPANDQSALQTLNVDYTVQNAGNINGGTVTFVVPPPSGSTVTLNRAVEASINTNYVDAQTINGQNLDNSFEREMLVAQQNQTKVDERSLRYQTSSLVPDSSGLNIIPQLPQGYIWIGSAAGGVAAALLDQDPDSSTLQSELANNAAGTDGAGLVGYYNVEISTSTTVRDNLNVTNPIVLNLSNNTVGSSGASLVGYYDPVTATPTNVKDNLDVVNNAIANTSVDQTGEIIMTMNPVIPTGWILYSTTTIGSATSGANYANADSQPLYEMFWDNYSDVICPVSGGRGGSAAADFAADKTLLMPPVDGRTFVNLNPYTAGETFGSNTVQLTVSEMPSHGHLAPTNFHWLENGGGSGIANAGTNNKISSGPSQSQGGDAAHENRQESIGVVVRIKL